MEQVNVNINGVNINATHFTSMSEDDAIKAMQADRIVGDAGTAKKVLDIANKAVADAKKAEADRLAAEQEHNEKVKAQNTVEVKLPLIAEIPQDQVPAFNQSALDTQL